MTLEERRKKYGINKPDTQLQLNFNINTLIVFCSYALSSNTSIHRASLSGLLQILLNLSEMRNEQCETLKGICIAILRTRLDQHLSSKTMILNEVYGIMGGNFDFDPNNFTELSNDEVTWVENTVSSILNTLTVDNKVRMVNQITSDFIGAEANKKESMARNVRQAIEDLHNEFRQNDMDRENQDDVFSLSDLRDGVTRTIERMKSPSYKLSVGIQAMNDILAGGFEGSRVYCFFALPGEGKTTTLINIAKQIKIHNRGYICKDPTKKPAILILSMENKLHDLISTLFATCTSDGSIADYTPGEAERIMINHGLYIGDDNPIEILLRYKPIYSVDTNYLYTLCEEYAEQGYEIIAVVQDYIKRIRPVQWDKEERFRLGNVINEFANFAKFYDIPVITASQLNREAARVIDACRDMNKADLVRKLGRANIGESSLIDENLDATIFLTPEYTNDGQKFMGVKIAKHRYPIYTNQLSFYIPFEHSSEVKMLEDVGGRRLTKTSLSITSEENIKKMFGINAQMRNVSKPIVDEDLLGGTAYSSNRSIPQPPMLTEKPIIGSMPKLEVLKLVA